MQIWAVSWNLTLSTWVSSSGMALIKVDMCSLSDIWESHIVPSTTRSVDSNDGLAPLTDMHQGYTSLGGKKDTHPNPHLKKQGQNGQGFRPAYELTADDEERLGRES